MSGKEMGKWLAEDTTTLWRDIRLNRYYCFMKGYSIYIGTASTLYCRTAKIIIIIRIDIQLINIRYTNLWTDQQASSIRGRRLCRALYLLLIAIDIDRPFHIPIGQTVGIDRHFHVPIGHSDRYRSTVGHNYCKSNSMLCRFIRTYWPKK